MTAQTVFTYIYLPGQTIATPAGKLEIVEDGRNSYSTFQYGRRYLQNPDRIAIDAVNLPLPTSSNFIYRTQEDFILFGGIRDASPDGWGRHLLEREKNKLQLAEADYLLLAGEQRVGALAFGRDLSGPLRRDREFEGKTIRLQDLLKDAQRVDSEEQLLPEHQRFFVRGSSLGGARPKASVIWNGEWWLAKFARQDDRYDIVRTEYATMMLAKKCGLNVPEVHLEHVLDKDVYLIKRFDRLGKADGGESTRQHFHSALTMLNAHESESKNRSYEDIADILRQKSAIPEEDCRELFRRMVFNILVNNTDDHLRNHGFLNIADFWNLSPLYDVVPQIQIGLDRDMAIGVGLQGRAANLKNALSNCNAFYLRQDQAKVEIKKLIEVVSNWRHHFKACGFTARQIDKLAGCFSALDTNDV